MATLSTCPFCGGKTLFSRIPQQGVSAICGRCGAIAMLSHITDREGLAKAWNRRTSRVNFSLQNKPALCPFCASQVKIKQIPGNDIVFSCPQCGMIVSFVKGDNLQISLAYWNSRV